MTMIPRTSWHYKVVKGTDPDFSAEIEKLIKVNWQLIGGVSAILDGPDIVYCQAMIQTYDQMIEKEIN